MKKLLLMLLTVVMLVGSIPMPFSEAKADRAVHFFEQLKHTDGDFYDKPFILLPWEKKIIRDVYGTVNEDGTRQYKFVYIEVPKKNGKSELGAGAALYHLFADGERNGEIYGCAADRKQAAIVYKVAKRMVEMTPALQKRSKIRDSSKTITDKISGSVYEVLSAESFTKHGFKTSACIFDELHAQPNRDLWDVMTFEAGATRRQPLWWVITTAGDDPDRASIGWEIHEYAIKIASGEYTDPAWYVVIYSYDGDDIYNEVNWHLANPSLGTTKSLKSMREAAITAKNKPADERLFRWLDLNQWITSKLTTWLPLDLYDQTVGDWDECDQEGKDCYLGLDLSTTTDLSAIAPIFPPQVSQLDWRVLWDAWIPKENMIERIRSDRVPYDLWAKDGWVIPTEGNVIDYVAIKERILALSKRYKIIEVVADPAFATMLLQELQDAGLNVVTVPQTFVNLTDPMNQVETLLKSGKMTHLADPVARWAFGNTSIAKNGSGLIKYVKETRGKSVIRTKRIDPMAAMITAMCRARFYKGRVDMSEEILSDDWGM
ncbi:MAG: terminase TerL endonuclease subunit [Anaerolineaceae bacterium]